MAMDDDRQRRQPPIPDAAENGAADDGPSDGLEGLSARLKKLLSMFVLFDRENNGQIDRADFLRVFQGVNIEAWPDERCNGLFDKIKTRQQEHGLSFEDLVAWLDGDESRQEEWRESSRFLLGEKDPDDSELNKLLDNAKHFNWDGAFDILKRHPGYIDMRPPYRRYAIIHHAAYAGSKSILNKLIFTFGADPELKTQDGLTPTQVAQERAMGQAVELIGKAVEEKQSLAIPAAVKVSATLENSNYIIEYGTQYCCTEDEDFFSNVESFLTLYLELKADAMDTADPGTKQAAVRNFLEALREKTDAMDLVTVQERAVAVWTYTECCFPPSGPFTFYGAVNQVLRWDTSGDIMTKLAIFARTLNNQIVCRRAGGEGVSEEVLALPWPSNFKLFRGSWMPMSELRWFETDREYRIPMFLATSQDATISKRFLKNFAKETGEPDYFVPVFIIVHIDRERYCQQVNFCEALTTCAGEVEWLFAAYSTFRVRKSAKIPARPKATNPCILEIDALPDNKDASDSLPLAIWH